MVWIQQPPVKNACINDATVEHNVRICCTIDWHLRPFCWIFSYMRLPFNKFLIISKSTNRRWSWSPMSPRWQVVSNSCTSSSIFNNWIISYSSDPTRDDKSTTLVSWFVVIPRCATFSSVVVVVVLDRFEWIACSNVESSTTTVSYSLWILDGNWWMPRCMDCCISTAFSCSVLVSLLISSKNCNTCFVFDWSINVWIFWMIFPRKSFLLVSSLFVSFLSLLLPSIVLRISVEMVCVVSIIRWILLSWTLLHNNVVWSAMS